MVDRVAENKYIKYKMSTLPNERAAGEAHIIKRGESLWSLAKEALIQSNGKTTNAEISEYMLRIAKLNGLDTVEKMNSVKANTKILMPESVGLVTSPEGTTQAPVRNSAEQSAVSLLDTLNNDRTIYVEKSGIGTKSRTHYNVYNCSTNGYYSTRHPVMCFSIDNKTGKIIKYCFEDVNQTLNPIAFDYDMDETGRIYRHNDGLKKQQIGKISNEELKTLEGKLKELSIGAPQGY